MKRRSKYRVHALLLFALLLGLAGCSNPLSRFVTPERPRANGEIVVYTAMDEGESTAYLRLFRAQYPDIQINLVTLTNPEILDHLLAERDAPEADVIWGASSTFITLLEWYGILAPYAPERVEQVFLQFRDSNVPPYWVGFGASMSAFCVNTSKLEELGLPKPESWSNLFDPVYTGQIASPKPNTSSLGYMITEVILELYGEIQGWENLDALDKNVKVYTDSSDEPCQLAADGEVAIGVSYDLAAIQMAATGQPVEAVFATDGAGWEIEANALIRKDEVKEASQIFLDWAISEPAMQVYGESRIILAMPVEGHFPPPGVPEQPLSLIYDKNFPWASANHDRIIIEWLARYENRLEESE